ncbi:SPFH domain-containing protein [Methanopyrus sp. KOL6]|uniref:SPFH domain-containing protein n=1 Tax=Methanopyrus sp. KOL6 TaxID=1937004 RepID=UPI0012F78AE4|nr:SPFH domain-containing protein [Methanopyrus sp. KOL6]
MDPASAVMNVEDYGEAVFNLAQTTLRSVLGEVDLDDILAKREELSERIREIVDEKTEGWGIHVTGVEIRDVILPEEIRRAITETTSDTLRSPRRKRT